MISYHFDCQIIKVLIFPINRLLRQRILVIFAVAFSVWMISSCERPNSPSFELEHRHAIPLINEITYQFLGDSGAIIDTTSTDFQDLFTVGTDGLVSLGVDVDFDLGSFDDALPSPEVEPFDIDARISDLEPDISGSGSTDFETVTGLDPAMYLQGAPLNGGSAPNIEIPIEMDEFLRAVTTEGNINITLINELGFDIDVLEFHLASDGLQVGSPATIFGFAHGSDASETLSFADGEIIEVPLSLVINVIWPAQNMQGDPGELTVADIENDGISFESAMAVFGPQLITDAFETTFIEGEFTFESPGDYIEIAESVISFSQIRNSIDIDIESLVISFPGIILESGPGVFNPADSLVITLEGNDRIRRSSNPININGFSFDVALDRVRVFATDNAITMNVNGISEDTHLAPPGDRVREVTSEEGVTGEVSIAIVETSGASGVIEPRMINLNESDDKNLDIMDPDVRIETEIEDLSVISEKIRNLQLTDPSLSLSLTSGIGVENRIYAAIVGVSEQGTEMMLSGLPGSAFYVSPDDTISGLLRGGTPIPNHELLAIDVAAAQPGTEQSIEFNPDNSNIEEFLSNLPVEIYFIGKTLVNPNRTGGSVFLPIELDSSLGITIPVSLTTENGEPTVFSDSVSVSLSDLPGDGDDTYISSAAITISYNNLIPLDINLDIVFLDEFDNKVTRLPLTGMEPVRLGAAAVNTNGFSVTPEINMLRAELTEEQLRILNRSEKLNLTGELLTSDNQRVSIRAQDSVTLRISADFKLRVRVD